VQYWLSERRRDVTSGGVAVGAGVILLVLDHRYALISVGDTGVLVLFSYLLPYLVLTLSAFSSASPERLRAWAGREARGTTLQRYVYGTAPGPAGRSSSRWPRCWWPWCGCPATWGPPSRWRRGW
jgi:hypothetical protein